MSKILSLAVAAALIIGCLFSCSEKPDVPNAETVPDYTPNTELVATDPIELRIVGDYENFKALDQVSVGFHKIYPNCTIVYEHVDDYVNNLIGRLVLEDDRPDLFLTTKIAATESIAAYSLDFNGEAGNKIDWSEIGSAMVNNYRDGDHLYSIPIACNIRGVLVNKTLIESTGHAMPENREQFLTVCAAILDMGYVPIQYVADGIGQLLMYPYFCNLIAHSDNYEQVYEMVNTGADGCGELFRDPIEFYRGLLEAGYIDYSVCTKYSSSYEANLADFMKGEVAFIPTSLDDWDGVDGVAAESDTFAQSPFEYDFIYAPVGVDGSYGYLSPWRGIAVNSMSTKTDWCLEFLNYFMRAEQLETFATMKGLIPNTGTYSEGVTAILNLPPDHVTDVGTVTFSYNFWRDVTNLLNDITKNGTSKTADDYIAALEKSLKSH